MTLTQRITRQEAEGFLYMEARILDGGHLEEWLNLFTSDGIYWVPIDENTDPELQPSVIYDDTLQRSKRVYQLLQGTHFAQVPPSRTIHMVSNVEVSDTGSDDEAVLYCNTMVSELRPGDHQDMQLSLGRLRFLASRCEYRLRYEQDRWAIALKKVLLIDRDLPLYNLTFII